MSLDDPGRRAHYGYFYEPDTRPAKTDRPFVVVMGNCQAESTRILLDSSGAVDSFRVPPVHEFTEEDTALLRDLLARTDVLVTQPVRDDYRDLPIGADQLAALLPSSGRVVKYPVLRYDGLTPYHAIVRDPQDPSRNPPVVPYHDLRILAAAAHGAEHALSPTPSPEALRELHGLSVAEIRKREQQHGTVAASDILEQAPVWHTINHPNNDTLAGVAQRVLDAIVGEGEAQVTPPADREMLGNLRAPVDAQAAEALGVSVPEGREVWRERGEEISFARLEAEQLAFYRDSPQVVAAGMERHAERLALLELAEA